MGGQKQSPLPGLPQGLGGGAAILMAGQKGGASWASSRTREENVGEEKGSCCRLRQRQYLAPNAHRRLRVWHFAGAPCAAVGELRKFDNFEQFSGAMKLEHDETPVPPGNCGVGRSRG